jgi:YD repeat-containing protein
VIEPFRSGKDVIAKFVYDGVGNLTRLISPRAWDTSTDKTTFTHYVTEYGYDKLNRLIKVTLPTDLRTRPSTTSTTPTIPTGTWSSPRSAPLALAS